MVDETIFHAIALVKSVDINTFIFTYQFEILADFLKLFKQTVDKHDKKQAVLRSPKFSRPRVPKDARKGQVDRSKYLNKLENTEFSKKVLDLLRNILLLYFVDFDIPENNDKVNILRRLRAILNYRVLKLKLELMIVNLLRTVAAKKDFIDIARKASIKLSKSIKGFIEEIEELDGSEELENITPKEFKNLKTKLKNDADYATLSKIPEIYESLISPDAETEPESEDSFYRDRLKSLVIDKSAVVAIGSAEHLDRESHEKLTSFDIISQYSELIEFKIFSRMHSFTDTKKLPTGALKMLETLDEKSAKTKAINLKGDFGAFVPATLNGLRCAVQTLRVDDLKVLDSSARIWLICKIQEESSLPYKLNDSSIHKLLALDYIPRNNLILIRETVIGSMLDLLAVGLNELQVLTIFYEVAKAIAFLHRTFFTHGQISPENIIITKNYSFRGGEEKSSMSDGLDLTGHALSKMALNNRVSAMSAFSTATSVTGSLGSNYTALSITRNSFYRVKLTCFDLCEAANRQHNSSLTVDNHFSKLDWKDVAYISPDILKRASRRKKTFDYSTAGNDIYSFGMCLFGALLNLNHFKTKPGDDDSMGSSAKRYGKLGGKTERHNIWKNHVTTPFAEEVGKMKLGILSKSSLFDKESTNGWEDNLTTQLISTIVAGGRPNTSMIRNLLVNNNDLRYGLVKKKEVLDKLLSVAEDCWKDNSYERLVCSEIVSDLETLVLNHFGSDKQESERLARCLESLNGFVDLYDEEVGLLSVSEQTVTDKSFRAKAKVNPDGLSYTEILSYVDKFLKENDPSQAGFSKEIAREFMNYSLKELNTLLIKRYGKTLLDNDRSSVSSIARQNLAVMLASTNATHLKKELINSRPPTLPARVPRHQREKPQTKKKKKKKKKKKTSFAKKRRTDSSQQAMYMRNVGDIYRNPSQITSRQAPPLPARTPAKEGSDIEDLLLKPSTDFFQRKKKERKTKQQMKVLDTEASGFRQTKQQSSTENATSVKPPGSPKVSSFKHQSTFTSATSGKTPGSPKVSSFKRKKYQSGTASATSGKAPGSPKVSSFKRKKCQSGTASATSGKPPGSPKVSSFNHYTLAASSVGTTQPPDRASSLQQSSRSISRQSRKPKQSGFKLPSLFPTLAPAKGTKKHPKVSSNRKGSHYGTTLSDLV